MKQANTTLSISTNGQGLTNITSKINGFVKSESLNNGLLTCFIQHTSASLTIQENADPDVQIDLNNFMSKIAPENSSYIHSCEGPDDMPAHIKTSLTDVQLSIPIINGRPALGTWQGVYLFEHRTHPHTRNVVLHFIGE